MLYFFLIFIAFVSLNSISSKVFQYYTTTPSAIHENLYFIMFYLIILIKIDKTFKE
jgi:hypothetical protein